MKHRIANVVVIVIGIAAGGLNPSHHAWAYEEERVADGATITGRAIFKGAVPPPRPFGLIVYPDIELCERISDGKGHRLLRDFTVSKDGGLQDVVVVVEDVKQGKPFPVSGPKIAIKDCSFTPFMSVIRDRQNMTFQNHDSVIHDIQTYAIEDNKRGDRIFDRAALAESSLTQEIKLPKGQKVVWVQCGKHSFMQTWAYVVDSPYDAITTQDGTFSIQDLPPGRYRVTAWHPFMKLREQTIEVAPNSKVVVNFEFGKQETK
ncbi:MAG: hypothetical protein HY204_02615 [Nitrospirae bacterium]|nr:hypothetical protein [Nitrospirota bacterium]